MYEWAECRFWLTNCADDDVVCDYACDDVEIVFVIVFEVEDDVVIVIVIARDIEPVGTFLRILCRCLFI